MSKKEPTTRLPRTVSRPHPRLELSLYFHAAGLLTCVKRINGSRDSGSIAMVGLRYLGV
jgi:hypothetical protein